MIPRRVLVTGAGGFLGSHVVRELLAAGHAVRALERPGRRHEHLARLPIEHAEGDLLDEPSLHRACAGCDALVNAAGVRSLWAEDNELQWRVNVDGFAAAVRAACARKLERIVHVSSTAAVGATRDATVLDERARWIGPRVGLHYVATKKEAQERALAAAWAGIDIVIVCPSMLVGPRADGGPPPAWVRSLANGRTWFAPPGGVSVSDVEDAARGVVLALERGAAGQCYILAGRNLTRRELCDEFAKLAGVAGPRFTLPRIAAHSLAALASVAQALGVSRRRFAPEIFRAWTWSGYYDSSKAERELGYRVRPLVETLARTLATSPAYS